MKRTISLILAIACILGCVLSFASCAKPANDPEKAKEKLEAEGYVVVLNTTDLLLPDGVKATLLATTKDDYLMVIYYEDNAAAKDAWEEVKADAEKKAEEYEDFVCERSGKMIYYGTKQAVKDAG